MYSLVQEQMFRSLRIMFRMSSKKVGAADDVVTSAAKAARAKPNRTMLFSFGAILSIVFVPAFLEELNCRMHFGDWFHNGEVVDFISKVRVVMSSLLSCFT